MTVYGEWRWKCPTHGLVMVVVDTGFNFVPNTNRCFLRVSDDTCKEWLQVVYLGKIPIPVGGLWKT